MGAASPRSFGPLSKTARAPAGGFRLPSFMGEAGGHCSFAACSGCLRQRLNSSQRGKTRGFSHHQANISRTRRRFAAPSRPYQHGDTKKARAIARALSKEPMNKCFTNALSPMDPNN